MLMTVEQVQGKAPVTILKLQGDLDGSNYLAVIDKVKELYTAGARRLLVDMSEMHFMSSAGLVALHSMVLLFRGQTLPEGELGWDSIHAIERDQESSDQKWVKLLNPQPRVCRTLEVTGLIRFFEVHTDQAAAIDSFG